jgi:hypothetical protein
VRNCRYGGFRHAVHISEIGHTNATLIFLHNFLAIGFSPGGSGYFICIQTLNWFVTKFMSGGLHEKHVVATWSVGNQLSICFSTQGKRDEPVSRWPVAGPSGY